MLRDVSGIGRETKESGKQDILFLQLPESRAGTDNMENEFKGTHLSGKATLSSWLQRMRHFSQNVYDVLTGKSMLTCKFLRRRKRLESLGLHTFSVRTVR